MPKQTYPLGRHGQLLIGDAEALLTAMDTVAEARDVTVTVETSEAEMGSRASGGIEQTLPNATSIEVTFELRFKANNPEIEFLMDAAVERDIFEAAALTLPHDVSGSWGPKGQFWVSNFGSNQPLREGQRVPVTLKLWELDEWHKQA